MTSAVVPVPPTTMQQAHRDRRLIPWVGSGLSSAVAGRKLPDYEGLISSILKAAMEEGSIRLSRATDIEKALVERELKSAARMLRTGVSGSAFTRIVRSVLTSNEPRPSQHHVMLNLLRFHVFLTTNYDRVLDQVIRPQPEILSYRDHASLCTILDTELRDENFEAPLVFKLNGDISAPSTIVLGQADSLGLFDPETPLGLGMRVLLRKFLSEFSLLFLGYSFQDPDYRRLLIELGRELGPARGAHYALIPEEEFAAIPDKEALREEAGIELQPFQLVHSAPDGDRYRVLWQFLSQIAPGRPVDTRPSMRGGSFYLTDERPRYLRQQNDFERTAHAFRFLTPALTNAFATREFLEQKVPADLEAFRSSVSDWENWRDEVIDCMKERRATFDERIRSGCEFRILCDRSTAVEDLESGDPVKIGRYRYVLELLEDPDLDVELRFRGPSSESRSLTSYACLLRGNASSSDVAVAYASQGTSAEYISHVFEMNTSFSLELLVMFEREWARATPEHEARNFLRDAIAAT